MEEEDDETRALLANGRTETSRDAPAVPRALPALCDPSRLAHRLLVLLLMCFLGFGEPPGWVGWGGADNQRIPDFLSKSWDATRAHRCHQASAQLLASAPGPLFLSLCVPIHAWGVPKVGVRGLSSASIVPMPLLQEVPKAGSLVPGGIDMKKSQDRQGFSLALYSGIEKALTTRPPGRRIKKLLFLNQFLYKFSPSFGKCVNGSCWWLQWLGALFSCATEAITLDWTCGSGWFHFWKQMTLKTISWDKFSNIFQCFSHELIREHSNVDISLVWN